MRYECTMSEEGQVDVWERTKGYGGKPVEAMNRRLFMQLLAYESEPGSTVEESLEALKEQLVAREASAVLYEDVNHPRSIGVLSYSENPEDFVKRVRPALDHPGVSKLRPRSDMTMVGRTYSTGYEPDLKHWLLRRPAETVNNPDWPWAIWYPLRRNGAFEQLEDREKGGILREHAEIGKAYGTQDLAHDVRLACHGLDTNDSDFVIGLIGKELHPLSHVVQTMRKTRQTSQYIATLGPFFVGYKIWQTTPAQ